MPRQAMEAIKMDLLKAAGLLEQKEYKKLALYLETCAPGRSNYELWESRQIYEALPEETVLEHPSLIMARAILCIMRGDMTGADGWKAQMQRRRYLCRVHSAEHAEIEANLSIMDLVLPNRRNSNLLLALVHTVTAAQNWDKLPLISITANRPSIMNGGCDFTEYCNLVPKVKGIMKKFAAVLYGTGGVGMAEVATAECYYYRNDTMAALMQIVGVIPFVERDGDTATLMAAMFLQTQIMLVGGQLDAVEPMIENIRAKIERDDADYLRPNLAAMAAWAAMYDGNYPALQTWMEEKAPNEHGEFCTYDRFQYFVKLRGYMVGGRYLAMWALAEQLRPILSAFGRRMEMCELELLLSMAQWQQGQQEEALLRFEGVVDTARKYSYVRLLANEGELAFFLLREYQSRHGEDSFAGECLEEARKMALQYPSYLRPHSAQLPAMTQSELEILRLLAAGRTNQEIGEFMSISLNTVKFHCKNIFQKLSVKNRRQAVLCAKEFGLIP